MVPRQPKQKDAGLYINAADIYSTTTQDATPVHWASRAYPSTGHPPTTAERWREVRETVQSPGREASMRMSQEEGGGRRGENARSNVTVGLEGKW